MRRTGLLLATLFALSCGGSNKPAVSQPDDTGESTGLETPETRCLAIAAATREHREGQPEKIVVKHVLIQWSGSTKPKPGVTRTRGEACLRALEARSQLQAGETFDYVVKNYSDEPGAASREGVIGSISRKDVVPPFADAAFELQPGEVSHVVETKFGFHIIMRTE